MGASVVMAGVLFCPFVFSENDIENLYSRNGFGNDKEILNNRDYMGGCMPRPKESLSV